MNKRKVSLQRNYKLNSAHLKNKFKLERRFSRVSLQNLPEIWAEHKEKNHSKYINFKNEILKQALSTRLTLTLLAGRA